MFNKKTHSIIFDEFGSIFEVNKDKSEHAKIYGDVHTIAILLTLFSIEAHREYA
jgi:hypothetical protein